MLRCKRIHRQENSRMTRKCCLRKEHPFCRVHPETQLTGIQIHNVSPIKSLFGHEPVTQPSLFMQLIDVKLLHNKWWNFKFGFSFTEFHLSLQIFRTHPVKF